MMAISRDNAEIVAKEIQISLNLFERAEHVLNVCRCKSDPGGKVGHRVKALQRRREVSVWLLWQGVTAL